MAKTKKQHAPALQAEKESISLGDYINTDVLQQLKKKKTQLAQQEQERKETERQEELERKKREKREREKNKTFEDWLNESDLSWRDFK